MAQETIEIGTQSLTVDTEAARYAIDDWLESDLGEFGYSTGDDGDYRVVDDGFDDEEVILTNGNGHLLASPSRILEAIDEATKTSFVEYVRENVEREKDHETVEEDDIEGVYIADSWNELIAPSTFYSIRDDNGIQIRAADVVDGELRIKLRDVRGEE